MTQPARPVTKEEIETAIADAREEREHRKPRRRQPWRNAFWDKLSSGRVPRELVKARLSERAE